MGCYSPLLLKFDGYSDNGKKSYKFTGIKGSVQYLHELQSSDPRDVLIPCKKCIGCRLDYSRRWADRLMLELDHSKTALFFTLTYDDDNVIYASPNELNGGYWYSLCKKDLQDFNKRLRYFFRGREIRFYSVGEYGDCTLRPHYHGIYYGLSLSDFPDAEIKFLNPHGQPIYTSNFLSKIWKKGICSIGNVSWQSCAYVARYNLKKLKAGYDGAAESRGCIPEFSLMSRNPGIGSRFLEDHPEIFDNPRDKIVICDEYGVKKVNAVNMPDIIFKKLELTNPELYAKIKEEKQAAFRSKFLHELSLTDLDEGSYMSLKESNHEKAVCSLVRPL